ncbi:MAG: hypothetical protein A3B68_05995 [Candidatus Melainabacteria bacterium RIFCSPHIGHO2_02_FULL_34_12]|nr:MAG: hypothetical protein A3B68_05995 [Candidatus Melainabacteria bacterium RIFCSPHIGHO2_02_FULL_34_12]
MLSLKDIESYFPDNMKGFKNSILREYIQCKILEILFDSQIGSKITFIGGTALRILYNTGRFSMDLDFDSFDLNQNEFVEASQRVKKKLELEGLKIEIETKVNKKTFHYRIKIPNILYSNELTSHINEKMLIKVDTEPQGFKYTPEKKLLSKFDVLTHINVASIDILLSMKINAVFTRKRTQGRDFYDIVFLINKTKPNYNFLKLKLGIDNSSLLRERLLLKCKELNFEQLAKDLESLVFNPNDFKKVILFPELIKETEFL